MSVISRQKNEFYLILTFFHCLNARQIDSITSFLFSTDRFYLVKVTFLSMQNFNKDLSISAVGTKFLQLIFGINAPTRKALMQKNLSKFFLQAQQSNVRYRHRVINSHKDLKSNFIGILNNN